jgi:hypothetical protein
LSRARLASCHISRNRSKAKHLDVQGIAALAKAGKVVTAIAIRRDHNLLVALNGRDSRARHRQAVERDEAVLVGNGRRTGGDERGGNQPQSDAQFNRALDVRHDR